MKLSTKTKIIPKLRLDKGKFYFDKAGGALEHSREKSQAVLREFRRMPDLKLGPKDIAIEAMRGNPNSDVLIIAPPCNADEYENGTPFSSVEAVKLHEMMFEQIGFNSEKHAFVISVARFTTPPAMKCNKAHCEDVRKLVVRLAEKKLFRYCIVVGDDAFKFVFGRGKKPSMAAIAGTTVFHADVKHLPVFSFPNMQGIVSFPQAGDTPRDVRFRDDWADKLTSRFIGYVNQLGASLKTQKLLS